MGQLKDPQIFIPIKPQRLSKEVYRKEVVETEDIMLLLKKNKLETVTNCKLNYQGWS